ncbi:MAG: hypothetical protein WBF53_07155 [Litorimonas sp.]
MSALNHFQTYSQRENHVTNNTMLMLRHVYRTSPSLLEVVLRALPGEGADIAAFKIGPRFAQQVRGAHSVPDAVLSQEPLHIYLEAKHGGDLYGDQLDRHIASINAQNHPSGSSILVGLTRDEMAADALQGWQEKARHHDVAFVAATYRSLLDALETACADERDLVDILEDYRTFLGGEGLLPDRHRKLAAMLCGTSRRENVEHGAYYEPASRNSKWAQAAFLGTYHAKRVSHVGRIEAVAVCRVMDGALHVDEEELGSLTDAHRARIEAIVESAAYYPGLGAEAHRYYLVDQFAETNLHKKSSGGMMGHRYLDIAELAGELDVPQDATAEDVAGMLQSASYT